MTKRTSALVSLLCFAALLGVMLLLFALSPPRGFSEIENRMLAQAPALSGKNVADGSFMSDFETYLTDQFPFRDQWMDVKAACERLLLKKEYNGVFLGARDTLIVRYEEPDPALLERNLRAVNTLAERPGPQVFFALIPGAVSVWAERLPANAPNADQRAVIADCYRRVSAETVDIQGALDAHAQEDIFYRTDHHWTTLGAYYGYTAFAKTAGFEPVPLAAYSPRVESESFYGSSYSRSGVHWIAPDTITSYVPDDGVTVTNYPSGEPVEGKVYDRSFLEKKDKYAMFYGGNTPLLVVKTRQEDKPKLLLVRDSYADSMSPFLFAHYSELHLIDLRYYRLSLADYIRDHDIDQVLVIYAAANFSTDRNAGMAGF